MLGKKLLLNLGAFVGCHGPHAGSPMGGVAREHPHSLQSDGTRQSSSGAAHQRSSSTGGELHRLVDARFPSRVTKRTPAIQVCMRRKSRTIAWPNGVQAVARNAPPILSARCSRVRRKGRTIARPDGVQPVARNAPPILSARFSLVREHY